MAYSIEKEEMIDYLPEALREMEVKPYQWIDNLNFTLSPYDCLADAESYEHRERIIFRRRLAGRWGHSPDVDTAFLFAQR